MAGVDMVGSLTLVLPVGSQSRKDIPVTTGVFDYFPAALAEVAKVSKVGNDKHNPGQPLHWSRGKSNDHADAIGRHLLERGSVDPDTGLRHSAQLAWRALANLQQELEDAGLAPLSRGSSYVNLSGLVSITPGGGGGNTTAGAPTGFKPSSR